MSGLDRTAYNTLQQLLSSDLNLNNSLVSSSVLDALKYFIGLRPSTGGNDIETFDYWTPQVLGGLGLIGADTGVAVTPGMLIQPNQGNSGAYTPNLDSNWVMGHILSNTTVPVPVLGVDTWYLIQARASLVTTTETRNIWNPGTQSFGSTPVGVRYVNTIEFAAKVGTATQIPLPDAGWLPVGAVLRLASGAAPSSLELVDLRPLPGQVPNFNGQLQATIKDSQYVTDGLGTSLGPLITQFSFEATDPVGGRAYAKMLPDESPVDLTSAQYKDPNTTILASRWYYIYLCPWGATYPRHYDSVNQAQGVLVLSHIAPTYQGSNVAPDNAITLPNPWGAFANTRGICVGALKRNAANTGWCPCICANNKATFTAATIYMGLPDSTAGLWGANWLPVNAKAFDVGLTLSHTDPAIVSIVIGGPLVSGTVAPDTLSAFRIPLLTLDPTALETGASGGTGGAFLYGVEF